MFPGSDIQKKANLKVLRSICFIFTRVKKVILVPFFKNGPVKVKQNFPSKFLSPSKIRHIALKKCNGK
jgi:hypothetical protein